MVELLVRRRNPGFNYYMVSVDVESNDSAAVVNVYYGTVGGKVSRDYRNITPINVGKSNEKSATFAADEYVQRVAKEQEDVGYERIETILANENLNAKASVINLFKYRIETLLLDGDSTMTLPLTLLEMEGVLIDKIARYAKTTRTDSEDYPRAMMYYKSQLLPVHEAIFGIRSSKQGKKFPSCPFYVQLKYDGVFCLVTPDGLRTRGGKDRHTPKGDKLNDIVHHIWEEVKIFYDQNPHVKYLNAEIWHKGFSTQRTTAAVKKWNSDTAELKLVIFDIVDSTLTARERLEIVKELNIKDLDYIKLAYPMEVESISSFLNIHRVYVQDDGNEGLMLIKPEGKYEPGKRVSSKLKYICFDECDVKIVDVLPVPNAPDQAMLYVMYDNRIDFKLTLSEFSEAERRQILTHKSNYIGSNVTIRHRGFTDDGVPRGAIALEIQ